MINKLVVFFGIAALAACAKPIDIKGAWVEPVPGMPGKVQGFVLSDKDVAKSINMATLQYDAWNQQGNRLILSGKSIGNHQTINFSEVMTIKELSKDTLILNRDGDTVVYHRQKK